jgi:hypothetical protein
VHAIAFKRFLSLRRKSRWQLIFGSTFHIAEGNEKGRLAGPICEELQIIKVLQGLFSLKPACPAQDPYAPQRICRATVHRRFHIVESLSWRLFILDKLHTALRQNPIETHRRVC